MDQKSVLVSIPLSLLEACIFSAFCMCEGCPNSWWQEWAESRDHPSPNTLTQASVLTSATHITHWQADIHCCGVLSKFPLSALSLQFSAVSCFPDQHMSEGLGLTVTAWYWQTPNICFTQANAEKSQQWRIIWPMDNTISYYSFVYLFYNMTNDLMTVKNTVQYRIEQTYRISY